MRVFKYRGGNFDRDLKSLSEDNFWAPTRMKLNDPYEGLFLQDSLELQLDLLLKLSRNSQTNLERLRSSLRSVLDFVDKVGIYSLSKNQYDELLWAHYSSSHTGFCIEYDLNDLISYDKNDLKVINVEYSDSPPKIFLEDIDNEKILKKMIGVKSNAWKNEDEIRIISSTSGNHAYDYRAVKAVYFGLRMEPSKKDEIMSTLKGRGIRYFNMILKNESYKLDIDELIDPYKNSKKYKYSIAPIADYAIDPKHVNEKYKSYVSYLYKSAEIVRREPDCIKVEMVEFSPSKSTQENPVIFVQYDSSHQKTPKNYYLNINDIEHKYKLIDDINN